MASIVIKGDTSGSVTISAPSVAGTQTLNLQAASGTLATTAQASIGTKNLIINGNMQIAQRGTSVASITSTGGGYFTVDRFAYTLSSGGGTWTQSQDADAPEGFAKSLKLSCTATGTYGATTNWNALYQSIEGFNLQQLKYGTANAESLTVSFWVKSNQTGTYSILYYGGDSGRGIASEYTILSANTWEKKTITIAGDTSGIINNDNGSALSLYFTLAAGSLRWSNALQTSWGAYDVNGSVSSSQVQLGGSVSDYLQITGVQLEASTEATPFENRMYSTELAMCQRYYEKNYDINTAPATNTSKGLEQVAGTIDGNQNFYHNVRFAVPKRANPSINFYKSDGTANTWRYDRSGASNQSGTPAVGDNGDSSFYMRIPSTGATWVVATMAGFWTANAEL